MWVEFVGSFLCSERFFHGYSGFPLSSKICILLNLTTPQAQGPVVRSLGSANRWLRGIKSYRFPWYLTLDSANHASSNPGQEEKNEDIHATRGMRVTGILNLRAVV